MNHPANARLSDHLLREADKFLLYPQRVRRTRSGLSIQDLVDRCWRNAAEWRKTFAPPASERLKRLARGAGDKRTDVLDEHPEFLDEVYCRDLLKAVPGMVGRTLKLSELTLAGVAGSEFVYLREAANCYVLDLPSAAVALARAAIEHSVRERFRRFKGKKAVVAMKLGELIADLARTREISAEGEARANRVKVAGDRVLHDDTTLPADPLSVVEDARAVILELSKGGRQRRHASGSATAKR